MQHHAATVHGFDRQRDAFTVVTHSFFSPLLTKTHTPGENRLRFCPFFQVLIRCSMTHLYHKQEVANSFHCLPPLPLGFVQHKNHMRCDCGEASLLTNERQSGRPVETARDRSSVILCIVCSVCVVKRRMIFHDCILFTAGAAFTLASTMKNESLPKIMT
jgi:hypothetical protein